MNPQEIIDLRARVLRGETIPEEELAAGIAAIRQGRTTALAARTAKKPKTGAEAQAELDGLLGKLGL